MELDFEEKELVLGLVQAEIIKHRQLAKLQFLEGVITKERLDWHESHAKWLDSVMAKLHNALFKK